MNGVWNRLRLMVAQGALKLFGADVMQVSVLDGELLKIKRIEPYGLSHRPKPGAQVYMVFPSGDRANGIALVVGDRQYQMDLAEGEVALHDDVGNYVKLGQNGAVTVKASTSLVVDAPAMQITGTLSVAGATTLAAGLAVSGALTNNGVNVGSGHKHPGVAPGGASTGAPQ